MNERAIKPGFPLGLLTVRITVGVALLGIASLAVAAALRGLAASASAVAWSAAFVWIVSVMSLVFVALFIGRGPASVAAAHFLGAAGRVALCIAAGWLAVTRMNLAPDIVWITIAAIYLPIVIVESIGVAKYVRDAFAAAGGTRA